MISISFNPKNTLIYASDIIIRYLKIVKIQKIKYILIKFSNPQLYLKAKRISSLYIIAKS